MEPHGISGIHHLTLPVADLETTGAGFSRCLRARHLTEFDHRDAEGNLFAIVLKVPGVEPFVQLRLEPSLAEALRGFCAISFEVAGRAALEDWARHLDEQHAVRDEISHRLIGDALDFSLPDGTRLQLYTRATQPPADAASRRTRTTS
jgi:catechol 2,3-dioxygenase-like lactoylglutathione lyase family enzyme